MYVLLSITPFSSEILILKDMSHKCKTKIKTYIKQESTFKLDWGFQLMLH